MGTIEEEESGESTDGFESTVEISPPLDATGAVRATPRSNSHSPEQPTKDSDRERAHHGSFKDGQVIEERYEIQKRLGRGGFGAVYSAHDRSLNRLVAIKQSNGLRSFVSGQIRNEARAVASLNHPNIVQIHDLVQLGERELIIVMECLEGTPLSKRLRQSRLDVNEAVKIGVEICNALIHAHERQLVHSDLKPANLFLCDNGLVKLLDFGLAVAYFPDQGTEHIGGTPGYMSPEQIRGESHLIDGRTDIWAFGVVMYEMLTGTRPFAATNARLMQERTLLKTPPPPRQLNPEIDNELQRIVLKCLQPLIKARYTSAADLREDITHWLDSKGEAHAAAAVSTPGTGLDFRGGTASPSSLRLVKRGLQPFTEIDASTYMGLIPGPRDRNGVPDSIRFWKRWVESADPNTEYPVGVLYGPSGSGKTSYIRAGLFKQLGPEVCRVYIECRPGDLGGRLTRVIEAQLHSGESQSSLRDLLQRLRSGDSHQHGFQKLLIVLDQFESWAHTASLEERIDFAEALRQCDGVQLRALVVTRDDYWTGAKELLQWLELPMQEGRNVASVDLLDPAQAEQILEMMGRETGTLPPDDEPLTNQQRQFITQSVKELTVDGSVICVHLVMFAQMISLQKWTPRALNASGGVAGACSLYFQELFEQSGRHSPEYRRVAPALPAVLTQLLPDAGNTVAEVNVSQQELAEAAAEAGQSHLLKDCLKVLCDDLRIVTVVGADVPIADATADEPDSTDSVDRYRLAHDFLVEPIGVMLARQRSRSWRGRTRSRLAEMSDTWARRQLNAYLPGFFEYLTLLAGSCFQRRGVNESRFLRAATRLHAGRISVAVISLVAFLVMTVFAWHQSTVARDAQRREMTATIDMLFNVPPDELSMQIDALSQFGNVSFNEVSAWSDSLDSDSKLRSRIYLQTVQPKSFASIAPLLGDASPEFFQPILAIAKQTGDAVDELRREASAAEDTDGTLRAAILLAYLGDESAVLTRLRGSNDADADQAFILEAIRWRGEPEVWADIMTNETIDATSRYHASIVVGAFPSREIEQAGITVDFESLINSPDAGLHGAGRYLAHQMGEDVFAIPLSPPADANWRVGPDNTPMVRLEAATLDYVVPPSRGSKREPETRTATVESPFWLATIPVSQRLYAEFVASDPDLPDDESPTRSLGRYEVPANMLDDANQPAMGTSLAQAYVFCNWLSRRENLTPCYRPRDVEAESLKRDEPTVVPIPWAFDETADGYRVATEQEFQIAARCGYTTGYAWRYATELHSMKQQQNGVTQTARFMSPLFTVIPNRFGLFLNDPECGSWICGHPNFTAHMLDPRGMRRSQMTIALRPTEGIFLVQTAKSN